MGFDQLGSLKRECMPEKGPRKGQCGWGERGGLTILSLEIYNI